jgi:glycosyltransferase involved in cell wall biosynthesis
VRNCNEWHLITCEYPPKVGGVSEYAFVMARELARAGDEVHVWCESSEDETPQSPGVIVHRELGSFSPRDLRRAGKLLDEFPGPRRLFVQWVPHGYGYHSMNVFFCLWLRMRACLRAKTKRDQVEIMFHEVWLSFGISWKANIAAAVHRVMVALLKGAASRIWISCEAWRKFLQGAKAPVGWLPVPSTVPADAQPESIAAIQRRCCEGAASQIVGHLGIGDALVEEQLRHVVPGLLRQSKDACFLLIGKRSDGFSQELQNAYPDIAARIYCSGMLASGEISAHIGACDLLVQPYVDGISTRRTAAMAVLANGRALLTTSGHSTEPFWLDCRQLAIVPAGDTRALIARVSQLLDDDRERGQMAASGKQLYHALFDASVSVEVLRGDRGPWNAELVARSVAEALVV